MSTKTITQTNIDKMLGEGEEVLLIAQQSRIYPGGSIVTPNNVYVTNRRVIYRNPSMLGIKKEFLDFAFRDLANVQEHKGLFTTEIELVPRFEGDSVLLPAVKKKIAEEMFGLIRKGMDGGFGLGLGDVTGNTIVQQMVADDPITKLERLGKLRDKGIISKEEYEEKRVKLLGDI